MKNLAVIFDLDGVLIDSVGLNWQAYNEVLARYGVHVPDSKLHRYVGRTLVDQVEALSADYSIQLDVEAFERQTKAAKEKQASDIQPIGGATHFLDLLKESDVPVAVGTSNDRQTTLEKLGGAGLQSYFEHIVTQSEVDRHKPEPDVYLEGAKQLGVSPEICVVIEDAPAGIDAAHNAGMKCVAVKTPYTTAEQLAKADLLVDSLDDISMDTLQNLMRDV